MAEGNINQIGELIRGFYLSEAGIHFERICGVYLSGPFSLSISCLAGRNRGKLLAALSYIEGSPVGTGRVYRQQCAWQMCVQPLQPKAWFLPIWQVPRRRSHGYGCLSTARLLQPAASFDREC